MTRTARTHGSLIGQTAAIVVALALAAVAPTPAEALITLQSTNAEVHIDETSQTGLDFWTANNNGPVVDNVAKEWFWFRTASMTSEASIDTLNLNNGASDLNGLDGNAKLVYDDPGAVFSVQIDLTLTGGAHVDAPDTLVERIDIFNLTASPIDFVFFEYTDFDLGGTPNDDDGSFSNSFKVSQTDQNNPFHFLDTVAGTAPTERAIVSDGSILTSLIDGALTNLNALDAAPVSNANVSWAFQWNYTQGSALNQIGPNSSVGFSKTKTLAPEPGTAALAALGLLGLALYGRKP